MLPSVYGPVPHRDGFAVGVDLVGPPRRCDMDCVYCPYSDVSCSHHVKSLEDVMRELELFSGLLERRIISWIIIRGAGEQTLCPFLGEFLHDIRKRLGDRVSISLLTNGIGLMRKSLNKLHFLEELDEVVFRLDAGSQKVFNAINRPQVGVSYSSLVNFIKRLRDVVEELCLEVTLLRSLGISNTSSWELRRLIETVSSIAPSRVKLTTPIWRLPNGWKPLTRGEIMEIYRIMADILGWKRLDFDRPRSRGRISLQTHDMRTALLSILARRPSTKDELLIMFDINPEELQNTLCDLMNEGLIVQEGEAYRLRRCEIEDSS